MLLIIRMLTLHGWKGGITFAKIKKFEESSLFAISMLLHCNIYAFALQYLCFCNVLSISLMVCAWFHPSPRPRCSCLQADTILYLHHGALYKFWKYKTYPRQVLYQYPVVLTIRWQYAQSCSTYSIGSTYSQSTIFIKMLSCCLVVLLFCRLTIMLGIATDNQTTKQPNNQTTR